MNCMKCGVEIPENQVFCDHCLAVMDEYPVKPGTHIHLPKRAEVAESVKRTPKKKRTLSTEEKLSALHSKVSRLRLVVVILFLLLCFVSAFLALRIYEEFNTQPATGKNYTIDTSKTTSATTGK